MGDTISFSVARTQPALAELNATVEQALEERQLPPQVGFAVQLVIDELLSNIVKNGSGALSDSAVGVRLHFETGAVAVEIENRGDRFNPLEQPDPDLDLPLEQRQIGGLGIHLLRKMMDDFEYSYRDGNNLMLLRKKFPVDE
jgi:serine/threonine-protein kinase RsbW